MRGGDSNSGLSGYEPDFLTAELPRDIQESGHRQFRKTTDAREYLFGSVTLYHINSDIASLTADLSDHFL